MAKKSKCTDCKKELEKQEKHIYSNKGYCIECYELKCQEREYYNQLISYICELLCIEVPTGLTLKQIKEYKDKFLYSYTGIHYCLWYCRNIKNMQLESKYGIGIVKYEYENAKKYYEQQQKIIESVSLESEEKVRKIVMKPKVNNNMKNFLIDIQQIINK